MRVSLPRRAVHLGLLFLGATLFVSCGGDSGSPSPTPTNVLVSPGADTLISIGDHRTFTAQVLDANGDPIDGKTVTWSSTAPGVLSIDATSGVATAVANGSAQVKATAGALEGSASVIVTQIVATVTVTPGNAAFTAVGDTARFTAVAKDGGGTVVNGVQVIWSISDNTVATIDTLGLAKAKGPGTALVTALVQTRAGYAALGVDPSVTQFTVLSAPVDAVAGEPGTTALTVELRDSRGNRVMNSSLAVSVAAGGDASFTALRGTTTVLADQGRATFTNVWFVKAGADRFKVTVGALPVDSSSLIEVSPAFPSQVRLDPIDSVQTAGVPIGLVARVYDRFGNLATNLLDFVSVSMVSPPSGGALFGSPAAPVVNGVATFPDLNLHLATGPWRLTAAISAPTERDTTPAMLVLPGPAASFRIEHLGIVGIPGAFIDSTLIKVTDAFGNNTSTDSLGDSLEVRVDAVGWPYPAYYTKAQETIFQNSAPLVNGHTGFTVFVRRPGRIRLVFSMPGFIPDTSDEVIPELPRIELVNAGGSVEPPIAFSDRTGCLLSYLSYCSGANDHGVLGNDSTIIPLDSLWTTTDSGFGGFPASADGGDHHMCSSVSDFYTGIFHVACWGDNSTGQLGGGAVGGESFIPVTVGGYTATSNPFVTAGPSHSCAIFDAVTACWGRNDVGQLGNGGVGAPSGDATTVSGSHQFVQIAAGGRHTCAVDDNQKLWCWGANDYGQLGDSGVVGAYAKDPIEIRPDLNWYNVAAGDDFTCGAVQGAGLNNIWCWGRNDTGILGEFHDTLTTSAVPVIVVTLTGSTNGVVAAGGYACAVIGDGNVGEKVMCWGANDHGQLGRGTVSAFETTLQPPVPVDAEHEIAYPVLGRNTACGLTNDIFRKLVCWGGNTFGQLGIARSGGNETLPVFLEAQY